MAHATAAHASQVLAGMRTTQVPEAVRDKLDEADLAAVRRLPGNKWPAGFRGLPDDAMIRVPSEFQENVPHRWHASTPEEFRRVIHEVMAHFPPFDPADFEEDIVHETEHAAAAGALGCASRFIFTAAPLRADDPDSVWYTVPAHVYTSRKSLPKLALAAITAAPSSLSDGDLADLRRMGYRDADDVARRIRESGQQLPLPKSVRRTGGEQRG